MDDAQLVAYRHRPPHPLTGGGAVLGHARTIDLDQAPDYLAAGWTVRTLDPDEDRWTLTRKGWLTVVDGSH